MRKFSLRSALIAFAVVAEMDVVLLCFRWYGMRWCASVLVWPIALLLPAADPTDIFSVLWWIPNFPGYLLYSSFPSAPPPASLHYNPYGWFSVEIFIEGGVFEMDFLVQAGLGLFSAIVWALVAGLVFRRRGFEWPPIIDSSAGQIGR